MSPIKRSTKACSAAPLRRLHLRAQAGQSTVEWVALIALIAVIIGGSITALMANGMIKIQWLPRRIACAITDVDQRCSKDPLLAAFGEDGKKKIKENMPDTLFEGRNGNITIPVDYRKCQERKCSDVTGDAGNITHSDSGQQPTVFTEYFPPGSYIDGLRKAVEAMEDGPLKTFMQMIINNSALQPTFYQYWFYSPDSDTDYSSKKDFGPLKSGFHPDDWEGYQVKEMPDGSKQCRASAHYGYTSDGPGKNSNKYNMVGGKISPTIDLSFLKEGLKVGASIDFDEMKDTFGDSGWGSCTGMMRVSYGSHAGQIPDKKQADKKRKSKINNPACFPGTVASYFCHEKGYMNTPDRIIKSPEYDIIPIVGLNPQDFDEEFGKPDNPDIKPPWRKKVWSNPYDRGTN